MEFLWLSYPKATFVTPSVSGELPASRFPCFPCLKIPRQILTLQTMIKPPPLSNFYHFSPMESPLSVQMVLSSAWRYCSIFWLVAAARQLARSVVSRGDTPRICETTRDPAENTRGYAGNARGSARGKRTCVQAKKANPDMKDSSTFSLSYQTCLYESKHEHRPTFVRMLRY